MEHMGLKVYKVTMAQLEIEDTRVIKVQKVKMEIKVQLVIKDLKAIKDLKDLSVIWAL